MNKAPKHKVALVLGVILFVASPFLFFLTPDWFFKSLLCSQDDVGVWFACTSKIYTASFYLSVVTLLIGAILLFWALQVKLPFLDRLFSGRYQNMAVIITTVVTSLIVYLVLLTSPFTSSWLQYPYYKVFCGKEPVIAIAGKGFSGTQYITPDMKHYQIGGFNQKLFCTLDSARAHNNQSRQYFKD